MITLWLAAAASAADICPTCTYPTVQAAVDSLAPGGLGFFTLASGVHDGAVVIDQGRRVVLTTLAADPVVLAAPPSAGAVLTVRGAAALTLTGISVDADTLRGIDASEGASVTLTLGLIYGRGPVGDGALVRLRDASLSALVQGFVDGFSIGDGGLLYAEDSDVTLVSCSFANGSGQDGGGLYIRATGARHALQIDASSFSNLGALGAGGAIAIEGEVDASLTGLLIDAGQAQRGGAIAVLGDGPVVSLDGVLVSSCEGYSAGGGLYQAGGAVTMRLGGITDSAATDGGGVSLTGGSLTLDGVGLLDNLAIVRGGGVVATGGALTVSDVLVQGNSALDGGGLWTGPDVTAVDAVRTTVCGNQAETGGGWWLDATTDVELRNLRFLDNLALDDGGALFHQGPGALRLRSSNLIGSTSGSGGGSAVSTAGALSLTDVLVGHSTGGIAIRRVSSTPVGLVGGTAWWANERGDSIDLSPTTPGAVFADPQLVGYTPGESCATMQDWGGWYGPLRDAGSADLRDPDGSRADIGAYGGPDASPALWTTDADGDGAPLLYDCDEQDPAVLPLADDPPYDGLDGNCDGADDFDADGDGHRAPAHGGDDCDDARADVYPGADELPSDPPVDMDCDGRFDADGDGVEAGEDCDDGDPEAHPGAVDDDPARDLDCDGFVDDPRLIRPVGCATGRSPGGALAVWLGLLGLRRRRR